MTKYVIKRLLLIIPIVLGVAIIVFTIINIIPGDPPNLLDLPKGCRSIRGWGII